MHTIEPKQLKAWRKTLHTFSENLCVDGRACKPGPLDAVRDKLQDIDREIRKFLDNNLSLRQLHIDDNELFREFRWLMELQDLFKLAERQLEMVEWVAAAADAHLTHQVCEFEDFELAKKWAKKKKRKK